MSDFQSNRALTPSNTTISYSGGPYFRYSLSRPVIPGEQTRTPWCLVDSVHARFYVTVYDNHNINRLKESIKEKKSQLLFKVDASSLELWKVRIFYIPADVLLTLWF